jgi:hypothetical protein
MNATFSEVDIHIFDVYTTVRPLLVEGCFQPKFQFLVQPDAYREKYKGNGWVLTPSFNVHHLSGRFQRHNHFWKNYLPIQDGDYWKLQFPFVCSFNRRPVTLRSSEAGFEGSVSSQIYLSALGWSSNLDIHLTGNIKLPKLRDFVGALRGVQPAEQEGAWLLLRAQSGDCQPANLSDIFSHFRDLLLAEVYSPDSPPQAIRHEERQFVISLAEFDGRIISFRQTPRGEGMTEADRAMLYSVLRGRSFDVGSFRKEIVAQPFTLTNFTDRQDFMITIFDYGTLMFLQQGAHKQSGGRGRLSCFASNVRSFAQITWMLYYFYQDSQQAAANPTVAALRDAVKVNLQRMRDRYNNIPHTTNTSLRYAKALFSHDKIRRLKL